MGPVRTDWNQLADYVCDLIHTALFHQSVGRHTYSDGIYLVRRIMDVRWSLLIDGVCL
jgi:hypothetical protein